MGCLVGDVVRLEADVLSEPLKHGAARRALLRRDVVQYCRGKCITGDPLCAVAGSAIDLVRGASTTIRPLCVLDGRKPHGRGTMMSSEFARSTQQKDQRETNNDQGKRTERQNDD